MGSVCPREPVRPYGTQAPGRACGGRFHPLPVFWYVLPLAGVSVALRADHSPGKSLFGLHATPVTYYACPGCVPRTGRRFGSRPSQVSDKLIFGPALATNGLCVADPFRLQAHSAFSAEGPSWTRMCGLRRSGRDAVGSTRVHS
ncbi:hypothetical protein LY78DRAFT_150636 [Colletotrichum sublineola]|nr:hypothetical protein LY78DRAFT_150636 [Colletotrichum sublineola]